MMERGWGRIVNVTTSFVTMLGRGRAAYGPPKAASEALVSVMASDLAGSGVTANVLIPGGAAATHPETERADAANLIPPEVMGPPAVFLASRASDGITARRFQACFWDSIRERRRQRGALGRSGGVAGAAEQPAPGGGERLTASIEGTGGNESAKRRSAMHEGTGFDDHEHGVIGGSGMAADTASGRSTQRQMLAEDRIELRSVGVDIGSATSQIIFSRLELEKVGNRYVTVKREALFESPILLTPYAGENSIDAEALGAFIESGYAAAGVDHDEIDTGALILTGVALLRENSWKIAELFAREAGRLVAVSAGDNLEAIMAAYGSGAVDLSRTQGCRILNVDIGGGTTKLAVCADGHLEGTLAIDVGARLIVTDEARTIIRIEPAGREVCFHLGLELEIGDELTGDDAEKIADCMTRQVAAAIPRRTPVLDTFLFRGEPLDQEQPVGAITFSGGVSEYVYAVRRPASMTSGS